MSEKYVYFLRPVGQQGPIKIGCSMRPQKRLVDILIWSPVPLEIAAMAPGGHPHERTLHHRFHKQRVHGEWFAYSDELGALVETVAATGSLPPMDVPRAYQEWREFSRAGRGKMPVRDAAASSAKMLLTKRIHAAEHHAHGDGPFERPVEISDIWSEYQGFGSPLPGPDQMAVIDAYINRLRGMPKAPAGRGFVNFRCRLTTQHLFARQERRAA